MANTNTTSSKTSLSLVGWTEKDSEFEGSFEFARKTLPGKRETFMIEIAIKINKIGMKIKSLNRGAVN